MPNVNRGLSAFMQGGNPDTVNVSLSSPPVPGSFTPYAPGDLGTTFEYQDKAYTPVIVDSGATASTPTGTVLANQLLYWKDDAIRLVLPVKQLVGEDRAGRCRGCGARIDDDGCVRLVLVLEGCAEIAWRVGRKRTRHRRRRERYVNSIGIAALHEGRKTAIYVWHFRSPLGGKSVDVTVVAREHGQLVSQQHLPHENRIVGGGDKVAEAATESRIVRDVVVQERLASIEDEQRLAVISERADRVDGNCRRPAAGR